MIGLSNSTSLPAVGEVAECLMAAIVRSLDTMAFISAEPLLAETPLLGGDSCGVSITFAAGDVAGRLEILTTRQLGEQIATTLVDGADADASAATDALLELANVTCGVLLKAPPFAAPGRAFILRLPTFWAGGTRNSGDGRGGDAAGGATSIELAADGHAIRARISWLPENDAPKENR